MKKRIISIGAYLLVLGSFGFLFYLLYPRNYGLSPYQEIPNTQYWNLASGTKIAYHRLSAQGAAKNYPILYIHGGPGGAISDGTLSMLKPFTEEAFSIYAYDQIGSGRSSRLENIEEYTAARHCSDLEEIVKKLEAEKVILIGQSWGSVLAILFAAKNPDRVAKIVLTGPGPIFPLNRSLAKLSPPDSLNIQEPIFSNQQANKAVYTLREKCIDTYAYIFGKKLVSDKQADNFFTHLSNNLNQSALYDTTLLEKSSSGGGYYAHIMTLKSLQSLPDRQHKFKNPVNQTFTGFFVSTRLKSLSFLDHFTYSNLDEA